MDLGLVRIDDAERGEVKLEAINDKRESNKNKKMSKRNRLKTASSLVCHHFRSKEKIILVIDIVMGLLVRIAYLGQAIYCIYMIATLTSKPTYWILTIFVAAILGEGLFVIVKRRGKEFSWFSISSFSYAIVMIVTIWTIELLSLDDDHYKCEVKDHKKARVVVEKASEDSNSTSSTFELPIWFLEHISSCQLIQFLVSLFLITSILSRWFLPVTPKTSREEFSAMLITFIINGADISKLMSYLDKSYIQMDRQFVYLILVFFSTSAIQFSFTLTSNRTKRGGGHSLFVSLFLGTEIWALCFILCVQEFPFLFVRSHELVRFQQIDTDFTYYFFAVKNLVLCLFEIYRIAVICCHHKEKQSNKKQKRNQNQTKPSAIHPVVVDQEQRQNKPFWVESF